MATPNELFIVGTVVRLLIAALGFAAMWSLWAARDARGKHWTTKMRDIWLCHMLFVASTVTGNLELMTRSVQPTVSVFVIGFAYLWTMRGAFRDTGYTH